jgi:SAM-dependent methyltransferase
MKSRLGSGKLSHKAKAVLPPGLRRWLRLRNKFNLWPPVGMVWFGSLNRVKPISSVFGYDRGNCIDRYYIEKFLSSYGDDIRGHVLEVADDEYTKRFGTERVSKSEVLYAQEGNPKATLVADLTAADHVPPNSFDCIILTQTLQFIYDFPAAITTLHRILKPNGVLLATFPGISQISRYDMDRWGDYWRFTTLSARKIFERDFASESVTVKAYGNVYSAVGLLHGLAMEDVERTKLDYEDADYEVVITVRALKSASQP